MKPERVLALSAIGTIPTAEVEHMGFRVLARPIAVERIGRTAAMVISHFESSDEQRRKKEDQSSGFE